MQTTHRRSVALLVMFILPMIGQAQTWNGTGGNTNVSTAGNWTPSGAPSTSGASLAFPTVASSSVNFDSAYSVNSLSFSGTSSYSLNGSGGGATLGIGAGGISDTASAAVFINNALALTAGANLGTNGSNLTFTGAIDNGGHTLALSTSGPALSILGNITGTGALTVTGTGGGVTFLTGTGNTYGGGTTLNSGTLQVGESGSLPGNVTDNGQLNFKPNINPYTYGGVISGSGSLFQLGTNVLTLSAANTFTGPTIIASGTVQIGITNALPITTVLGMNGTNSAALNVANDQQIDSFGGNSVGSTITIQSGHTFTLSAASGSTSSNYLGTISGSGQLVINGASGSKVKLTQTTPFGGTTTINGGQLGIQNTSGTALSGAVTVNNGGSLEGKGSISGSLTLNSGGTLTVDPSFLVGATTFNGGSAYNLAVANATGVAGTGYSQLSVTGALALGGASAGNQITLRPFSFNGSSQGPATNFDTTQNYSFIVANTTGGITGFNAAAFTIDLSQFQNPYTGTWSVAMSGNNLDLNYTGGAAIPEPAVSGLLAGLAAFGLVLRRRIQKTKSAASEV